MYGTIQAIIIIVASVTPRFVILPLVLSSVNMMGGENFSGKTYVEG
jgi:hypothetical protein